MIPSLIAFVAEYFYLIVLGMAVIFLVAYFYSRRDQPTTAGKVLEIVIATVCIGAIAFLLAQLGTHLIASPRPFLVSGQPPLIPSSTDNGFPSDHTLLLAVAAAAVTLVSWRWGLLFWCLALVVGLARVYAGVHHLTDVAGSLLIVAVSYGIYLLGKRLVEHRRQ